MKTSNQLLPCPFCGGEAAYQRLRDGSKYGAYECGECGAQGPDVRTGYGPEEKWRDKATAAWNERSADAPPAAAHGDEAVRKLVLPTPEQVMHVVMKFQWEDRKNGTGTTNWAANLGMTVVEYVARLNSGAAMRAQGEGEVQ